MIVREDIITLDGPTSSGKNSVGFLLAQKLGYQYIDSGMIYRAGTAKALDQNISLSDTDKILQIFANLSLKFDTVERRWRMLLDQKDVTDKLHTPEISRAAVPIAAMQDVRLIVKKIQYQLVSGGKAVVGGRDIGSEIFPDAKYKFWLTALVKERAKRRFNQLSKNDPQIKYEEVLSDMQERDKQDSERSASPMRMPQGAIIIDNTNLTIAQTVDEMLKKINA